MTKTTKKLTLTITISTILIAMTLILGTIGLGTNQAFAADNGIVGNIFGIQATGGTAKIQEYDPTTHLKVSEFSAPATCNGRGLAFDGQDLWYTCVGFGGPAFGGEGIIHKIATTGGADITTIPDPYGFGARGVGAMDIHSVTGNLWITSYLPISSQQEISEIDQAIFIKQLAQPTGPGFLTAQIPIGGSTTDFYTIEARQFAGFDALGAIPGEAIVIHKVDTTLRDRNAQVVDVDAVPNTNPNDAGAIWLPGEIFQDTANNISLEIVSMNANGFNVIINPSSQPNLVVSSMTHLPVSPDTDDLMTFTATVTNQGATPASATTLMFKIGGETAGGPDTLFNIPALASGASSVPIERILTLNVAQDYRNTATADYFNVVGESNEADNTLTDDFTVTSVCAIATATYGSDMAPQVQMLREVRDNILLNTESGVAFMGAFNEVYYSFSPMIADWEKENPTFKEMVKLFITPMIMAMGIMSIADATENDVLFYGLSTIGLVLGMYIVAPVFIIIQLKKKLK